MFRKRNAQSTLEYITVFAAIVAAVLVFAYAKLKPSVQKVMDSAATKIGSAADDFQAGATVQPKK